ncbi:MAG: DUF4197 domain-containing protein [Desulfobacterales bacterium]
MKKNVFIVVGAACLLLISSMLVSGADLGQTVKGVTETLGIQGDKQKAAEASEGKQPDVAPESSSSGDTAGSTEATGAISAAQASEGLKEALTVGVQEAVKLAGVEDGFYKNSAIKILLPENLQKADKIVRQLGGEELSKMLVEKMNRAAEKATPQAQEIFVTAIKDMQFEDAKKILSGGDNAATTYLKENTSESLTDSFYPVVKETMEEIGAIKTYDDYVGKFSSNPLMKIAGMEMDINKYVTEEAIDGLFVMVAEQEKKIRQNPAARVTDLLESVFGE